MDFIWGKKKTTKKKGINYDIYPILIYTFWRIIKAKGDTMEIHLQTKKNFISLRNVKFRILCCWIRLAIYILWRNREDRFQVINVMSDKKTV